MIIPISCVTAFFYYPFNVVSANTVEKQREQGVALVRTGEVDNGLSLLKQLLEQNQTDQRLIADYIVLSYEQNKFVSSDFKYIQQIQVNNFPEYAQVSVIKVLRDSKKFDEAESYARAFNQNKPSQNLLVWISVLQAESGKVTESRNTLSQINTKDLSADYLALVSYAYRNLNMPIEALNAAELSVQKNETSSGMEQYALALLQSGDYVKTQEVIEKYNLNENLPNVIVNAKLSEFTQKVKDAEEYYKSTLMLTNSQQAYEKLDQVIAEMELYEKQLPSQPQLRQRFYYDYMYALEVRNRNKDVIKQVPKIGIPELVMPAYARDVLAKAYLSDKQPAKAEVLYKSLFKEKNYADYSVYSGLYYSLIEQEKFKEANVLIDEMDKALPTFRYSEAKGVDRVTHDQRQEFLSLKGLNYAYRNEHDKAEKYFEDLISKAPNNNAYQHNLALIKRWREQPEASEYILSQYNGLEGIDQSLLINQMFNAQALGNVAVWEDKTDLMLELNPDDTGVTKSKDELNDRKRFSIQHQSLYSESKSDNSQLLNQLQGSEERDHATRLNSPWFNENYRVFVDHVQRWSKYGSR